MMPYNNRLHPMVGVATVSVKVRFQSAPAVGEGARCALLLSAIINSHGLAF